MNTLAPASHWPAASLHTRPSTCPKGGVGPTGGWHVASTKLACRPGSINTSTVRPPSALTATVAVPAARSVAVNEPAASVCTWCVVPSASTMSTCTPPMGAPVSTEHTLPNRSPGAAISSSSHRQENNDSEQHRAANDTHEKRMKTSGWRDLYQSRSLIRMGRSLIRPCAPMCDNRGTAPTTPR